MRRAYVVGVVVFSLVLGHWSPLAAAAQTVTVTGTARKEAKRPYSNYTVRARQVDTGQIAASVPLDGTANFAFTGLSPATYLMELVNAQNRVVCTAGPFNAAGSLTVEIDCDRKRPPVAWILLGAAGAAGITAGVLASQSNETPTPTTFAAPPASPSR